MTETEKAQERIDNQRELLKIKSELLRIGVANMPTRDINILMPKSLRGLKAVKWSNKAINVWNGRSTDFETYLPIFRQALENLKQTA